MKEPETQPLILELSGCCQQPTSITVTDEGKIFWLCNHCHNIVKNVIWKTVLGIKSLGGKQ